MINIDGESEGEAWASCAGGIHTTLTYHSESVPYQNKAIKIRISGLAGGHSGSDINKNRANANKLMGRILLNLYEYEPFNLISIDGGSK
jgi:dipeptidase D